MLPYGLARLSRAERKRRTMRSLGPGQIALIVVLIALLMLTGFWATSIWNATGDAVMDKYGWIALSDPSSRSSSGAG
jgi:hypothetical protein